MKRCIECGINKNEDNFYKSKNKCKDCFKIYYENNKITIQKRNNEYKRLNKNKIKLKEKEYRKNHINYYTEYNKNYRLLHLEYYREYSRNYYIKNKNYFKNYNFLNAEKFREIFDKMEMYKS